MQIEDKINQLPDATCKAHARIRKHIWKTPLMRCKYLSGLANVYFKLESEQLTGSFKTRGAFNKILSLKESDPCVLDKGFYTASSGNHGIGCVYMAEMVGCRATVYCREGVPQSKVDTLRKYGADVVLFGQDCLDAETEARRVAEANGQVYISPYNDWDVMAGNGTIGYEIYENLPSVDSVFVSVGGGGCIAGIAAYLKAKNKNIEVVGCSAVNSCAMHKSVKAGKLIQVGYTETLSDGTSGDIEEGSATFPVCCRYVDRWVDVSEDQIGAAVYWMLEKHHKVVEGSAGVSLAAYMMSAERYAGKNVVILICGSGIGPATLANIIHKYGP